METRTGWVALEAGRLLQATHELNFILYPDGNVTKQGINCKAAAITLFNTSIRDFMMHGGLCRARVYGTRCTATQLEPGWSPRSKHFILVSSILRENDPKEYTAMEEDLEETRAYDDAMNEDSNNKPSDIARLEPSKPTKKPFPNNASRSTTVNVTTTIGNEGSDNGKGKDNKRTSDVIHLGPPTKRSKLTEAAEALYGIETVSGA